MGGNLFDSSQLNHYVQNNKGRAITEGQCREFISEEPQATILWDSLLTSTLLFPWSLNIIERKTIYITSCPAPLAD